MKKVRGITLVSLVITIVVLLILSAVTLSLTLGERGIFTTAQRAVRNYKDEQEKELEELGNFENVMNNKINELLTNQDAFVSEIKITGAKTNIKPAETLKLVASNKNVTWSSANTDIATVTNDGTVTGVGVGQTVIMATTKDNEERIGSYTIKVYQEWADITSTNYGDYVNYPIDITFPNVDMESLGHKTDWRIFYKDNNGYVYLTTSYPLPYSEIPAGTELQPTESYPYSAVWDNSGTITYKEITNVVRTNYKMSWNKSTSQAPISAVSQLLDTNIWKKFAYNKANGKDKDLAEDAIGAPTLEMWCSSWNEKSDTTIYYDDSGDWGYFISLSSGNITYNYSVDLTNSNDLFFPHRAYSGETADRGPWCYWITSPSARGNEYVYAAASGGSITSVAWFYPSRTCRPVVRLKTTIEGQTDVNGVWQLN